MARLFKVLEENDVNSILRAMGVKQKGNRITEKQKRLRHSNASDILKEWEDNGVPENAWNILKSDNSDLYLKYDLLPVLKQCNNSSSTKLDIDLTEEHSELNRNIDFQIHSQHVDDFNIAFSDDEPICSGKVF